MEDANVLVNHYAILGAHPQLTDQEIRGLYRTLARHYHPDRPGGDASKFAEVTAAYANIGTLKARAQLRAAYALMSPMCAVCSGSGVEQKTKGFTRVILTQCDVCEGAGYRLDQQLKVYTKRRK